MIFTRYKKWIKNRSNGRKEKEKWKVKKKIIIQKRIQKNEIKVLLS